MPRKKSIASGAIPELHVKTSILWEKLQKLAEREVAFLEGESAGEPENLKRLETLSKVLKALPQSAADTQNNEDLSGISDDDLLRDIEEN